MKKKRVEGKEIYTYKVKITVALSAVFLSIWIIPNIITHYHPDFFTFISALNPFSYLSSLNKATIISNIKEIFFLFIFLFSTISAGKLLERLGIFKNKEIYLLYASGMIFNSLIVIITGFLGYILKNIYLSIILSELIIGIYFIFKGEFDIKNSYKGNWFIFSVMFTILMSSFVVVLSPEIFL